MISQSMPRRDSEDFGEQILTKVVKAGRPDLFFRRQGNAGRRLFSDHHRKPQEDQSRRQRHVRPAQDFSLQGDFAKFGEGFREVVDFIKRTKPEFFEQQAETEKCRTAEAEIAG